MVFLTIGHGAWGTAVASVLATSGNSSHLLALRPEIAAEINREHKNHAYVPGLLLSPTLRAVCNRERATRRRLHCFGQTYSLLKIPNEAFGKFAS